MGMFDNSYFIIRECSSGVSEGNCPNRTSVSEGNCPNETVVFKEAILTNTYVNTYKFGKNPKYPSNKLLLYKEIKPSNFNLPNNDDEFPIYINITCDIIKYLDYRNYSEYEIHRKFEKLIDICLNKEKYKFYIEKCESSTLGSISNFIQGYTQTENITEYLEHLDLKYLNETRTLIKEFYSNVRPQLRDIMKKVFHKSITENTSLEQLNEFSDNLNEYIELRYRKCINKKYSFLNEILMLTLH